MCAESALQNMPGWFELRKELVNDGFGPTADDASDSSEEEGEDDDAEDMIDRIDQDPAADSATINELLTHHAPALGRASSLDDPLTESLAVPADKKMRLKLLHRHHGISIANHGRLAYFKDFLEVFNTAVVYFQTHSRPIQHEVARYLRTLRRSVESNYDVDLANGDSVGGVLFELFCSGCIKLHKSTANEELSKELVTKLSKEAQMFGTTFLVVFDRRIGPYIGVYEAFELIDPWCPQSTKDSMKCVAALKKLCLQWNLYRICCSKQFEVDLDDNLRRGC